MEISRNRPSQLLKSLGPNQWTAPGSDGNLTPSSIARADYVAINLENPKAEDALLAAGMALAQGKPTVLMAPDRKQLPWFLQEADASYPGQVFISQASTLEDQDVESSRTAQAQVDNKSYDTFIGCLMSGLSPDQYAEGRSHLQKIDQILGSELGSPSNFCEGINVGSTESFGNPKECLVADLQAIKGSKNCVFYEYDNSSRPSGMWVELGAALAWGKPCTLLVPDLAGVPEAIKKGMASLKIVEFGKHDKLQSMLEQNPKILNND